MVRFKVWLLSARGREHDRGLGTATICNVGGDDDRGDYSVELSKFDDRSVWLRGEVSGFPRKLGGFDLAYRALRATVGRRNPATAAEEGAVRAARLRARGEGVEAMRALMAALADLPAAAQTEAMREAHGRALAWLSRHAPAEEDQ